MSDIDRIAEKYAKEFADDGWEYADSFNTLTAALLEYGEIVREESEALRKDAERHRWLINHEEFMATAAEHAIDEGVYEIWRADIEDAIDAAIKEGS